jgi:TonB family protein
LIETSSQEESEMTLSKETLEAASPAAKASAPATVAPPKSPDLNRLRADAVSLDVPVRVHGSRVTEVVRGVTPHTEPFEEETSTMIVFPQGGVVRMSTAVSVGQMLVLTNQKTKQDAICRVVKVRANSNTQSYVEVEFTHRQAGYWGVHFPADDEDPSLVSSTSADAPVVSTVSLKVEPLPKPPAPAPKNASAFASIGTKEEVQPSASSTDLKHIPAPLVSQVAPPPPPPPRASAPSGHVAPAAPAKLTPPPARVAPPPDPVEEELAAVEEQVEEVESSQSSRPFGTLTLGGSAPAHTSHTNEFSPSLGADSSPSASASAARSNSWMWMAACAFFLVAGVAGGAFYFRQHASTSSQAAAAASNSAPPAEQTAPAAQPTQSAANSFAAAPAAAPAETSTDRPSRTLAQAPVQTSVQEPAATQPRGGANAPAARLAQPAAAPPPVQSFAISNPRPIVQRRLHNIDTTAPTVVGGPALPAAVPDVLSSSSGVEPPPPAPPVRVGGQIVQPKLLRSVPPTYPAAARQAGISGNVVIEAQVDKAGNVGTMKVVSGPATLQASAVAAMRSWKYAPGTLDGTPIETQVTVTIHFQQQ